MPASKQQLEQQAAWKRKQKHFLMELSPEQYERWTIERDTRGMSMTGLVKDSVERCIKLRQDDPETFAAIGTQTEWLVTLRTEAQYKGHQRPQDAWHVSAATARSAMTMIVSEIISSGKELTVQWLPGDTVYISGYMDTPCYLTVTLALSEEERERQRRERTRHIRHASLAEEDILSSDADTPEAD